MALQYLPESGGTIASNGIFIPVSDLEGLTSAELADNVSVKLKTAGFLYSFFKKLNSAISGISYLATQAVGNKLGVTCSRTDSVVAGQTGVTRSSFTMGFQFLADKAMKSVEIIPLNDNDDGILSLESIFPNASKKAASASVTDAGVLIPSADIETYGSIAYASLDLALDCRATLAAIITYFYQDVVILRATGVTSAFFAKSRTTGNVTLPASATDATAPTTGIDANDLNWLFPVSESLSITIEKIENPDETVSVNVV